MRFWIISLAACLAAGGAVAKTRKPRADAQEASAGGGRDANGSWRIDAATTVGNCPSLIPTGLVVADNRIASAAGANVSVWGYVDDSGNIVARFTGEGEHVARFHGALKNNAGSGAWSSSTDMCGGSWRAVRQ